MSERSESRLESQLLVKYDAPVEFSTADKKSRKAPSPAQILCDESNYINNELEEILNSTVPPKETETDGKYFRQMLSRDRATRLDAISLQHNLDFYLKERQARNTGLCPIRRQLYTHCFDEIIRQVTIDSPERGLLLLRMRDEIKMTLDALEALYESAVAYGRQNADSAYALKLELLEKTRVVDTRTSKARREIELMRLNVDHTRRTLKEKREMDQKRFSEEIQFIKRATNLYKTMIQLERDDQLSLQINN